MKVIIYTRQSKHRDESVTHELQENACQSFAKSRGWEVVQVLNERGISGKTIAKRTEFQTALKMIKDKEAEGLLVWRWSRFARNTLDGLITLKSIEEEAKGQVHCALEQIDRSAMGKFSLTMMLGMAELESNVKGEQWNEALMLRLSKGLPPSGKVQFGYDKVAGQYIKNPEEAAILKEAYERYTSGEGVRSICEDFSARSLPAPGPRGWYSGGMFDLLDKVFYSGKISWVPKKGEEPIIVDGAHEAILSAGEWSAYRKSRKDRKMNVRPKNPRWMLSGLVVCGLCGSKMLSHSDSRGRRQLMCAKYNAEGKGACKGVFRRQSIVTTRVWFWLGAHLDEWASAMPSNEEARKAAEKALADSQAAVETAHADYSRYADWAYEHGILAAVSASKLAEKAETIKDAESAVESAQAHLASLVPVADVHERILEGSKLMGFSDERPKMWQRPDGEWEDAPEEVSEQATARLREALSLIIDTVVVLPSTAKSPRDPDRNHAEEVKIIPRKL
ncbi:recombinase family protein [Arthrobacter sp. 24S4-2]|uniref:recombinase family protein n=1 Tax=Arthrobacter sp. 24S4-2 TaxID=2575374 RepID=UPI001585ECC2|nr:recombinase family protein [Arthrobacter sp. 24S4-2]